VKIATAGQVRGRVCAAYTDFGAAEWPRRQAPRVSPPWPCAWLPSGFLRAGPEAWDQIRWFATTGAAVRARSPPPGFRTGDCSFDMSGICSFDMQW